MTPSIPNVCIGGNPGEGKIQVRGARSNSVATIVKKQFQLFGNVSEWLENLIRKASDLSPGDLRTERTGELDSITV